MFSTLLPNIHRNHMFPKRCQKPACRNIEVNAVDSCGWAGMKPYFINRASVGPSIQVRTSRQLFMKITLATTHGVSSTELSRLYGKMNTYSRVSFFRVESLHHSTPVQLVFMS